VHGNRIAAAHCVDDVVGAGEGEERRTKPADCLECIFDVIVRERAADVLAVLDLDTTMSINQDVVRVSPILAYTRIN